MQFEPLIPPALLLLLAALSAGVLAWYALRKPASVAGSRWAAIVLLSAASSAAVFALLLNPVWVEPVPAPPGRPHVTVLLDASASMAMPDVTNGQTRYQAASALAVRLAEQLQHKFDVEVRPFSAAAYAADIHKLAASQPVGEETDLASCIAGGLREEHPAGQALALLSDGVHNAGGGSAAVLEAARLARALGTPIYTHVYGGQQSGWDLAIELRGSQEMAYIGQKVPVRVMVQQRGTPVSTAHVELLYEGRVIADKRVTLRPAGPTELSFMVSQAKAGLYRYEARVEPVVGEITQANNVAGYMLRVVDKPVRVLMLEGKPYWDAKFLMRALSECPSIELDSFVRITEQRVMRRSFLREQKSGTQPAGETWKVTDLQSNPLLSAPLLKEYQVVILGQEAEKFLTPAAIENLQKWVLNEGGSLVCSRGSPVTKPDGALARMLPMQWAPGRESRVQLTLTSEGQDMQLVPNAGTDSSASLAGLPSLARSDISQNLKPLTVVLARALSDDARVQPALCYQNYGTGRVVVLDADGLWRWAFLPKQKKPLDEVYPALWQGLIRWLVSGQQLAPGDQLSLRADQVTFASRDAATATLVIRDEALRANPPMVELTGAALPDPRAIMPVAVAGQPGTFQVRFGTLPEGRYQARVLLDGGSGNSGDRTLFDVRSMSVEQLDVKARPDLMAAIAHDSGGGVLAGDSATELLERFTRFQHEQRPPQARRTSAWDRWWLLAAAVALWAGGWGVRRSAGLV